MTLHSKSGAGVAYWSPKRNMVLPFCFSSADIQPHWCCKWVSRPSTEVWTKGNIRGKLHHTFLAISIGREKEIMLHREQLQKEISVNRPRWCAEKQWCDVSFFFFFLQQCKQRRLGRT